MAAESANKFKVAVIQMNPKPLDPEHNFAHAKAEITKAAEGGASLAVLPEYHLTGWEPTNDQFIPLAREAHKYQEAYQELAAELKINICAGTIVQAAPGTEDSDSPTLLNISPFISYTGELLGTYIKTNIWVPEREYLTGSVKYAQSTKAFNTTKPSSVATADTPSFAQPLKDLQHAGIAHAERSNPPTTPHEVIQTPLGNIGILVCWDLAFPEAFRSLIKQDCKLILIPTFWTSLDMSPEGLAVNPDAEKLFLESALVSRAFENTCTVVFCNVGGPKEEGYIGLSGVYAPIKGRVEGSFDGPEEGMRIVEVDFGIQELAEDNYRIRQDMEGEEWHYGYDKVEGR